VETSDYYVPMTAIGSLYGKVYLRTLRPIVRRIYYQMPVWALKIVKPLFGI
jgi:hypothetical protein